MPSSPLPSPPPSPLGTTDVWKTLFLAEAMRAYGERLVSGCAPKPDSVPAPRLVCVETNPGPGPRRSVRLPGALRSDSIAAGLAAIGTAAGMAAGVPRSRTKAKKKKSVAPQPRRRGARVGNQPMDLMDTRSIAAPVVVGFRSSRVSQNHTTLAPFRTTPFYAASNAGGVLNIVSMATGNAQQCFALDVNDTDHAFGPAISQLALAYDRWRLVRLRITYRPMCTTNMPGGLVFGYSGDGRYPDGNSPFTTVAQILGLSTSVMVSPWVTSEFPSLVGELDNGWKYVTDATTQGGAEFVQQHAGVIVCGSIAALSASVNFGMLELSGEIEFSGLTGAHAAPAARVRPVLPAPTAAPAAAASVSSPVLLSVDEEEYGIHYCGSCSKRPPSLQTA